MALYTLMYHGFGNEHPIARLNVTLQNFGKQLDRLVQESFTPADPRQIGATPDGRSALITIDDGLSGSFDGSKVALEKGFVPLIFIIGSRVGTPGYLSEEQVMDLSAMGAVFGSHSYNLHDKDGEVITNGSPGKIKADLEQSIAQLESLTGRKPDSFSYPFGYHDKISPTRLSAHFNYGFTTSPMWYPSDCALPTYDVRHTTPGYVHGRDNPFAIPRVYVRDSMTDTDIVNAMVHPLYGAFLKVKYLLADYVWEGGRK